jgi:protease-4
MTGLSFSGQWYIEPGYAQRMEQIIRPRLEAGKDAIPANLRDALQIDARLSRQEQYVADYFRTEQGVAIIPINGAMSREGGMCSYGNEQLARWTDIVNRDEQTRAIVYKINSPGGTVDSTRGFADTVRSVSKPTVAWTPFAASAAYFVASQCTEIMIEDQLVGGVGSIGVLMIMVNQAAALEKQGFKVEIIRAEGSHDKALVNGIEDISDDTRAEIQTMLNACRNEFVGYVRRGRAGKLTSQEVFTGKMYNPADAIRLGLADRKGTLQQAIQRAVQLSK